ncbi:ATP-binding cassette domain-containing protein [Fulvivirgaceae bacterium BMA10]|uniref:ATP-binding cassette domain-containing protein n=1 Tax=Splendidivirga corallicola TaxID=3051826 RepID=A0ABT8KI47_9BACT|nr:ATP-binding cassette domain-containing protein [Fulvivirgaceae bacterium BMA10]
MIQLSLYKKLQANHGEMILDIDIQIQSGRLVAIYGESGAGKTSILRMLAGLFHPEKGKIIVNNQTWLDCSEAINLKPQKRKIGYVFQDLALFPNMSVRENLLFALDKGQKSDIVDELISIMELHKLETRSPDTLSGGQRQRVALARALVKQPDLLLLDEPLSAIDHQMRSKLQDYILEVHKKFQLTTILVSHDITEVFKLSDHIIVLENGRIQKQGSPSEVFSGKNMSGKFQFTGDILSIEKEEVVHIVSVLIGNNIVKVIVTEEEANDLSVGNKVIVASKAFNPIIRRIG